MTRLAPGFVFEVTPNGSIDIVPSMSRQKGHYYYRRESAATRKAKQLMSELRSVEQLRTWLAGQIAQRRNVTLLVPSWLSEAFDGTVAREAVKRTGASNDCET